MPRAKSDNTSDTPKPPSKRKSRPKFEVVPEQVAAPAAGWVYREHEAPAAKAPAASSGQSMGSIPMFAIGMMAMSIGAFVYVGLFAVKTLNSPVKLASGILGRLRKA